jgi:hypothetical protein
LITHHYRDPSVGAESTLFLRMFPKKKNGPAVYQDGLDEKSEWKNDAWGIYLKEERNKLFFLAIKASVAFAGGIICAIVWYSIPKKNRVEQMAFPWTVAAWYTAVLALVIQYFEEQLVLRFESYSASKEKVV